MQIGQKMRISLERLLLNGKGLSVSSGFEPGSVQLLDKAMLSCQNGNPTFHSGTQSGNHDVIKCRKLD
jgi:hypothetical protein